MRERLSMRLCAIVLTACRRLQEWQAVDVGARGNIRVGWLRDLQFQLLAAVRNACGLGQQQLRELLGRQALGPR